MVPGVSGLLDFAFPSESASGPRGVSDYTLAICNFSCSLLGCRRRNMLDLLSHIVYCW